MDYLILCCEAGMKSYRGGWNPKQKQKQKQKQRRSGGCVRLDWTKACSQSRQSPANHEIITCGDARQGLCDDGIYSVIPGL